MKKYKDDAICPDPRECFAKDEDGRCKVLTEPYAETEICPFQKSPEVHAHESWESAMRGPYYGPVEKNM